MIERCPFCGKKAKLIQVANKWKIECSNCACSFGNNFDKKNDAINAWNHREPESYNLNPETIINYLEENDWEKEAIIDNHVIYKYAFENAEVSVPIEFSDTSEFEDEIKEVISKIADTSYDFKEEVLEKMWDEKVSCSQCSNFISGKCVSNHKCYLGDPNDKLPISIRTGFKTPELGNLLFGNSRGTYPIDREPIQDIFWKYFEDLFDYHMYYERNKEDAEHTTDRGGYENDIFKANPYYWGDDEEIEAEPNFIYKPKSIEISWYKYPCRDAYSNEVITPELAEKMFKHCRESMNIT